MQVNSETQAEHQFESLLCGSRVLPEDLEYQDQMVTMTLTGIDQRHEFDATMKSHELDALLTQKFNADGDVV